MLHRVLIAHDEKIPITWSFRFISPDILLSRVEHFFPLHFDISATS